jgi:hypothetical protein
MPVTTSQINTDEQAGMSTIKFKEGGSLTLPFHSFHKMPAHIQFVISNRIFSVNKQSLSHIPEELE